MEPERRSSGVRLVEEPAGPVRATLLPTSRGKIIGKHPGIRGVIGVLKRVAKSNCTVLVTGESGTGKELAVAALHDASSRAKGPLVSVNCGAIPETLIESELFGHAKGAFTGAVATHRGKVGAAEGGTLFLDEVGELPLAAQVKLLRLLQQREYSPVGDSRTVKCDLRVVAATNRDLEAEVVAGRFREDLFYRLNVVQVRLPPLRERSEDVELLAGFFLKAYTEASGREDVTGFTPEALDALRAHDWPGNIRALENAVERAVLLCPGPLVDVEDLPQKVRKGRAARSEATALPDAGIDLRAAVSAFENRLIKQALERTRGNKNRAAQLLGLNRTTLVEMLKRKHFEDTDAEPGAARAATGTDDDR
ncbi:MAG: sigma-54-dependent Fis family transcriptional regulator [Deltaproteobacteria bacterium]|nr:sigma-54-dependent Fis family transcriptional regulator [Deltaproteobacteria bacterium]